MYGESWVTKLLIIRVQYQRNCFLKEIYILIDAVTIRRSASWWAWLGGSIFFRRWPDNHR